jgi:hypothetical protein
MDTIVGPELPPGYHSSEYDARFQILFLEPKLILFDQKEDFFFNIKNTCYYLSYEVSEFSLPLLERRLSFFKYNSSEGKWVSSRLSDTLNDLDSSILIRLLFHIDLFK